MRAREQVNPVREQQNDSDETENNFLRRSELDNAQSWRASDQNGERVSVEDRQSAERLGLDEYFFGDGVSVIEWADRFSDLIPETARWISFETKSETQRAITAK